MNLQDFSNKYYQHEINRKKLSALINFSESLDSFKDWLALEYIARWLDQEFLDNEGERFLDHILGKYGINYLEWSYKSPWVKREIASRRSQQEAFYFEDYERDHKKKKIEYGLPSFIDRHKIIQLELPEMEEKKSPLEYGNQGGPNDIVHGNEQTDTKIF